jgi:outer membrane lipoprotein LolB
MRILKLLLVFSCLLALSSCATSPTNQPPKANPTQTWGTRVSTLSGVQTWDLNAMIAIRNSVKKNSGAFTANLRWQQTPLHYTILLYGPLGVGATQLIGQPGMVKLTTADGKIYTAATPEQLVAEQTQWILPVSSLYYWIRGLPVPTLPAIKHFDAFNHLTELEQQGWHIQFLRYASIDQIDVPNKIFLFNPDLNVKIIIKEWKIATFSNSH